MKRNIIQISNPIFAIPKENTWYQYYDDIFISVLPSCNIRPYIRRKSESNTNSKKKDNPMCFWHSDWQYNKIEGTYGLLKSTKRTYEITITYENEIHRIDSVVENIAIEFQHTLEVSINEMNTRFTAHRGVGLIPILVLDFTSFNYVDFTFFNFKNIESNLYIGYSKSSWPEFIAKFKKWQFSKYFLHGNLFLDFNDQMIQIVPRLRKRTIIHEKNYFLSNIINLVELADQTISEEKRRIIEEKIEADRIQQVQVEEEAESWERENLVKTNKNKIDIKQNTDYKYYRCVLQEETIKNKIGKVLDSCGGINYISYKCERSSNGGHRRKHHIYELFREVYNSDPELTIEYMTLGKLKEQNKYEYLYAEILLKRIYCGQLRTIVYLKKTGKPAVQSEIRYELIEEFLHSTNYPALTLYNEEGRIISSDYYLFNVKIDSKEEWIILSSDYDQCERISENDQLKYRKTVGKIEASDKWNFIQYYCQNDRIPNNVREDYYNDRKGKFKEFY